MNGAEQNILGVGVTVFKAWKLGFVKLCVRLLGAVMIQDDAPSKGVRLAMYLIQNGPR